MNITFRTVNFASSAGVREALETELQRTYGIFKENTNYDVCIKKEKNKTEEKKFKCDISIKNGKKFIRGYGEGISVQTAIDEAVDSLIRKGRKIKTLKLKRRTETNSFEIFDNLTEEESEETEIENNTTLTFNIDREKNIELEMMTKEEAIVQMELLSHNFYMFIDPNSHTCIVYKKTNGCYGLIRSV